MRFSPGDIVIVRDDPSVPRVVESIDTQNSGIVRLRSRFVNDTRTIYGARVLHHTGMREILPNTMSRQDEVWSLA